MGLDRRQLLRLSAVTAAVPTVALTTAASAAPMSTLGIDAVQLGVRAGGTADLTAVLQNAIDQTAGARVPLVLGPGEYRTGELKLPPGTQLIGVRGATRMIFEGGAAMISARGSDHITLSGIIFDGKAKPLAEGRGLINLSWAGDTRIIECEIVNSGGHGIVLEDADGIVSGTNIVNTADTGIVSRNGRGVVLTGNTVRTAGNGGILVTRVTKGDDGTEVLDNCIDDVTARDGVGRSGNGIAVTNAANVMVRGNRVRRVAYSGVRGYAASNLNVVGNTLTDTADIAVYSESAYEGVVIANNTITNAAAGVAVVDFDQGGRLAVVQGNIIRNLTMRRPRSEMPNNGSSAGIGIMIEADAAITGNVVENAPDTGIKLGWGQFLRDVSVTGNVVRSVSYGITASVSNGAGQAVIAGNMISEATRGSIVGMDFAEVLPDDLSKETTRYAHLTIRGNKVR
jgi:uncharacterized secreted repeat protein (TIGR03808 family)